MRAKQLTTTQRSAKLKLMHRENLKRRESAMADNFRKVESGDLIGQEEKGFCNVFVCVVADDDVFVLAKPKIQKIPKEEGVAIVGYSRENCKVYDNNAETMAKNRFEILD